MNLTGCLFDIKRFTVHDGPGARTTLFLKGCSLRCIWCHNPEGIRPEPEPAYYAHKCIHCGECVLVCPYGAHEMEDGIHRYHRETCAACGRCESVCLGKALQWYGREMSVEEAVQAVLEDRAFYEQSGGGCTVSGGEPLLQADFCAAVFAELKKRAIHCAVDTSGAVPWEAFQTVLPHTDLVLFDLKHVEDDVHRQQVGAPNKWILENLRRLSRCGVPIEIRVPVIPHFNADEHSIRAIGEFLRELDHVTTVRLLPYHGAHSKFESLGLPDLLSNVASPDATRMECLAGCLSHVGIPVK
ncbi:MAG: glycyl-radical enzyme activating protein [Phycisphaerae bacterium]|nr:glycyl-radical enzyme activating protein [Phycisphaerae bacterium]